MITKNDIKNKAAHIQVFTTIPLEVEMWNPGDGVTHYRLHNATTNDAIGPYFMGASAFWYALDLMESMLSAM